MTFAISNKTFLTTIFSQLLGKSIFNLSVVMQAEALVNFAESL